ncbi:MAG TPA: VWA domain-containing protein [Thermoanaerobaculia bacterium]|nr:VWA domain-containing protein [Thermoanaerobaculia bacterium]
MPDRGSACRPAAGLVLALGAMMTLGAAGGGGPRAAPLAPPAGSGALSETTEVVAVEVPVQVVRDGEPVRGLAAADFEVYEGRKRLPLTGFEVLDLRAGQGQAVAAIQPSLRRHFLFLFDLSFSEPKSIVRAREMVRRMLPSLHPSDLVAVATYSSAGGPKLALGFTSDRRQVLKAIDTLGLPELVDRNTDPLQLVAAEESSSVTGQAAMKALAGDSGGFGALAEALLIDALKAAAQASDSANRQQQQAVVGAFTRSFTDLARLLASVHGRKQVIYLSEGFDTSIVHGVERAEDQGKIAEQSIAGEGYLTDSDARYGNTRGANVLEKMMEEFRRADCVIQAVDVGGLRAQGDQGPARPSGEGSLFVMAHDTGGELYRNFNDLGAAMGQLLAKSSLTYVLSIQPQELKQDGSYHPLRVALKSGPATRGAQVSYRQGYYAPRPYRQRSAGERQLAVAEAVIGGADRGELRTTVLAAPFAPPGRPEAAAARGTATAGVAGKAYVAVVIETDGASLLNGTAGDVLPVEVYAYAIGAAGEVQDFFSQSLRFELAKVIPLLDRTGLKFFGHLDLPPGDYSLRVLVRNAGNGDYGLSSERLTVPAFDRSPPVLLPPFFAENPGRWLMVRETAKGGEREVPYPFMLGDRAYVPALRPALTAAQEVAVALVGYNLPAGALEARATVLSADGRDLGRGDLTLDGRKPPDEGGAERLTATFRAPRGLEPGEYRLRIALVDAQGVAHDSAARFVVAAPGPRTRG